MRKVIVEKPGSYDQLKIVECDTPSPKSHEILIESKAIGVNFADCCVRMGVYKSAKDYVGWPITPGFEAAGVIQKVGTEVKNFSPGQKILAVTRFGAYATHITVPENQCFSIPENWNFAEAASFPAVFLTAYYALFELAHPRPGQTMLIHSAAGGVGGALIQLGKLARCRTIGVVGASHKVNDTEADSVIDKSTQDLWKEVESLCPMGCDVILDPNGAETLKKSYFHLSPGGKLVVYGFHTMLSKNRGTPNWLKIAWDYFKTPKFNPLHMTSDNHSVLAFNLSFLFDQNQMLREAMNQLLSWAKEETIHPLAITPFSFDDVAKAHKLLESGQSTGKLILRSSE